MSGFGLAFDPLTGDIYPGITQNDLPFLPSGMQPVGVSDNAVSYPGISGNTPGIAPIPWDQFNLGNNGQNIGLGTLPGVIDSAASSVLKPIGSAVTGTIGFFSQPGRWGSVIVGILLIAGGLFLLGKGPAVNLIQKQGKNLLVGA